MPLAITRRVHRLYPWSEILEYRREDQHGNQGQKPSENDRRNEVTPIVIEILAFN